MSNNHLTKLMLNDFNNHRNRHSSLPYLAIRQAGTVDVLLGYCNTLRRPTCKLLAYTILFV